MALPATFAGLVGQAHPLKSSGGNFYVVGYASADNTKLRVEKSSDPGTAAFANAGTDAVATAGVTADLSAAQQGDYIHVIACRTTTTSSQLKYARFSMGSDSWDVSPENPTSIVVYSSSPGAQAYIDARSDGDVLIAYNGATQAIMGTQYTRVKYARREGGTWTSNVAVDDGGSVNWTVRGIGVATSSDRAYIFYSSGSVGYLKHLTSANSLGTQQLLQSFADFQFPRLATYNDGGTIRCVVVCTDSSATSMRSAYWNDGDNPTVTNALISSAGTASARQHGSGVDVTDAYAIWRKNSDSDGYYRKSTDDGATWGGSDTSAWPTVTITDFYASVYQHGSNIVGAMVANDGGTWKYNEVTLRSATSTYNESISLGASSGMAATGNLVMNAAISLASDADFDDVGGLSLSDTITLGAAAAISSAYALAINEAVTMAADGALTISAQLGAAGNISLAADSAMALASALNAVASATLASDAAVAASATAIMGGSLTLTADAAMAVAAGLNLTDSITLVADAGMVVAATKTLSEIAALPGEAAIAAAASMSAVAAASLPGDAVFVATGNLVMAAPITLVADAGMTVSGGLNLADTATLSAAVAITTSASLTLYEAVSLVADSAIIAGATMLAGGTILLAADAAVATAGLMAAANGITLVADAGFSTDGTVIPGGGGPPPIDGWDAFVGNAGVNAGRLRVR